MADILGAGAGGLGNGFPLEQWWMEMPPVTRYWTTASVICSVLVQCHVISPFNMFYSVRAVFNKGQVCRAPTTHTIHPNVQRLTWHDSTGAFCRHSSTSARSLSILSSTSSSHNATPASSRSPQAALPPSSRTSSRSPPSACSPSRLSSRSPSLAPLSPVCSSTSGHAATLILSLASWVCLCSRRHGCHGC